MYKIFQSENIIMKIKPHSHEGEEETNIWLNAIGTSVQVINKELDVRTMNINADLVVSFGSGQTLACLAFTKPVVLPNWITGFPWEYGAVIKGGATESKSIEDFKVLFKKYLKYRDKFCQINNKKAFINQVGLISGPIQSNCLKGIG